MSKHSRIWDAAMPRVTGVSPSGHKIVGWYERETILWQVAGVARTNEDGELELVPHEKGGRQERIYTSELVIENGEITLVDSEDLDWPASCVFPGIRDRKEKAKC